MKDFVGNELNIGDIIICNDKNYSNLIIAKIVKFTPKGLKAIVQNNLYNGSSYITISLFTSSQVVKLMKNENDISNFIVKSKIKILNNEYLFHLKQNGIF